MGGKLYDAGSHFARLKNGLDHFGIELDTSEVPELCRQLIRKNGCDHGYVRVIASRGANRTGGLGYLPGETETYFVV